MSREDEVLLARRKLLKLGVYVAPAIVAAVVVTPANAATQSCVPTGCLPHEGCHPFQCKPHG
jgi:hypothetical protein